MSIRENKELSDEELERVLCRAVEYYFQGRDVQEAISISLEEREEIISEKNKSK